MLKNKNIFPLLLTLLSILLNISLITSKEIKIYEGESFNQALQNAIESRKKLFIIFFARNCEYCGYSVRVLKERVVSHYENNDQISFGVVNLDRQSNFWIGYAFNVTQVPFIFLIEEGKMYRYKNQFEENDVIEFIEEEKNIEDALDIPEDVGIFKKITVFMANLVQRMSNFFIHHGFSETWSNILSFVLLIFFFINMIYLELRLLNFIKKLIELCKKRKSKEEKNEKKEIDDNKDKKEKEKSDKDNKDEIKNDEEIKPKKE